jgi:hypothetical protein
MIVDKFCEGPPGFLSWRRIKTLSGKEQKKTVSGRRQFYPALGAGVHAVLGVNDVVDLLQGGDRAVSLGVFLVPALALVELAVDLDGHREGHVGRSSGLADHVEDNPAAEFVEQLDRVSTLVKGRFGIYNFVFCRLKAFFNHHGIEIKKITELPSICLFLHYI